MLTPSALIYYSTFHPKLIGSHWNPQKQCIVGHTGPTSSCSLQYLLYCGFKHSSVFQEQNSVFNLILHLMENVFKRTLYNENVLTT